MYIGRDKRILRLPTEPDSLQPYLNDPPANDLIALARQVLTHLEDNGLKLAVAESLTGGLIGHVLTETPGASRAFLGGVLAYDNRVKERIGVSRQTLDQRGAVSEQTAAEMAQGIRDWTGADIGLAVTGIAGPGGATETKHVGLTYVAVADRNGTACEEHQWSEDRSLNKRRAAEAALRLVIQRVQSGKNGPT